MAGTRLSDGTELLTTEQVIDRLLEDARLARAAATCVLPAVRFAGSWRFRRTDLDDWIQAQELKNRGATGHA